MDKSIMGLETEYGLYDPNFKLVQLVESAQDIHIANHFTTVCRWILDNFSGIEISGRTFLNNGGQAYIDGGHIELCLPECRTAREIVAYDNGTCLMFHDAIKKMEKKVSIVKNNLDANGNSFGCHENYFVPFTDYVKQPASYDDVRPREVLYRQILPFLVSRQIFAGSGSYDAKEDKFYFSQRSRVVKSAFGYDTLGERNIFDMRNENFASKGLRIHLILGDATMSDLSTLLKVGTTNIVLRMAADNFLPIIPVKDPILALNEINENMDAKISTNKFWKFWRARKMNALDIQKVYLERAHKYFTSRCKPSLDDIEVVSEWEAVLNKLKDNPMSLDQHLDCWIKKSLMINQPIETKSRINFQYHIAINGLYDKLVKMKKVRKLISLDDALNAITHPPATRALGRTNLIKKLVASGIIINSADWHRINFETKTVLLPEPYELYSNL